MTVSYTMQDHFQQTAVMTQRRSHRCFQNTQYRKQREVQLTRPLRLSLQNACARNVRGASTIRSSNGQPSPRQISRMPYRTSLERPKCPRSTSRRRRCRETPSLRRSATSSERTQSGTKKHRIIEYGGPRSFSRIKNYMIFNTANGESSLEVEHSQ